MNKDETVLHSVHRIIPATLSLSGDVDNKQNTPSLKSRETLFNHYHTILHLTSRELSEITQQRMLSDFAQEFGW